MADVNKDFKIDRNSFQEILASAFLVQQSKLDKTFFNTVAEIEQLMEMDHFSVDTIAEIPVEESPEVPINEGNEGDVTISSQDQPTSSEELETSLPVDAAPNHDALTRSRDPWTTPVIVLAIMLVLTLGWMLGRVSWRSTAIKPKPAIPAASQDNFDSREGNHQVDVTPPPQVVPKNKNSQISDGLVIYQNGRVIFRTDPGSASPRPEPGDAKAKSSSDGSPNVRIAHKVEPQYPELAKKQHIQGPVLMEAVIDGNGEVQRVNVISGAPILARAASAAVSKWRFAFPRTISPREFTIRISVNFRL
jgi:TonB family protein